MSLRIAATNAGTGLTANTRLAELVSRNMANATNEGYAARTVSLTARVIAGEGSGVQVGGATRAGDPMLTIDRRKADARAAMDNATSSALSKLSGLLVPGNGGETLSEKFAALDNALRGLEAAPESSSNQFLALNAAKNVASALNHVSDEATRMRMAADADIALQVTKLNETLEGVDRLNIEIRKGAAAGLDVTALQDERDRQLNTLNAIVPIRAVERADGGVTIYTQGGAVLMDPTAVKVDFQATPMFGGAETLESGALSGLTMRGLDATPTGTPASTLLMGGTLEAAFRTRDQMIPEFSAQADALAADLLNRFGDLGLDGQLFVDAYDPAALNVTGAQQIGLASRIAINPAVDPAQGGEVWRMRDGMTAAAPSALAADSTLIRAMVDAFAEQRPVQQPVNPNPPNGIWALPAFSGSQSAMQLAEGLASVRENAAAKAQETATFSRAVQSTMRDAEMRLTAVDTDAELRSILAIEKAYAANARVLQAVDEMLKRILEM
jgi:flagellar hook-associated protein 1 FlgK